MVIKLTKTEIFSQLVKLGCSDQYAEFEANRHGTGELNKTPQVDEPKKDKKKGFAKAMSTLATIGGFKDGNA